MQYTTGDSHYIETTSVAREIEAFNEQVRERGYRDSEQSYEDKEVDYIGDVQAGNYESDYKRIQIANAIERINAKISHMKPSVDGRVLAPGEDAQGMSIDSAPSGSDDYRDYYIREMAKRVARGEPSEDPVYQESIEGYPSESGSRRGSERSIRRRHRRPNK